MIKVVGELWRTLANFGRCWRYVGVTLELRWRTLLNFSDDKRCALLAVGGELWRKAVVAGFVKNSKICEKLQQVEKWPKVALNLREVVRNLRKVAEVARKSHSICVKLYEICPRLQKTVKLRDPSNRQTA
jgi:hypothetical protein